MTDIDDDIDDAKIAELRARVLGNPEVWPDDMLPVLDALTEARRERDTLLARHEELTDSLLDAEAALEVARDVLEHLAGEQDCSCKRNYAHVRYQANKALAKLPPRTRS